MLYTTKTYIEVVFIYNGDYWSNTPCANVKVWMTRGQPKMVQEIKTVDLT